MSVQRLSERYSCCRHGGFFLALRALYSNCIYSVRPKRWQCSFNKGSRVKIRRS